MPTYLSQNGNCDDAREMTDVERAAKKAVKENDLAMVFLTASADYASRIAHIVMSNLMDRFAKVNSFTATEMRIRLSKVKMKKGEDPILFVDEITRIEEMADKLTTDQITMSEYVTQVLTSTCLD